MLYIRSNKRVDLVPTHKAIVWVRRKYLHHHLNLLKPTLIVRFRGEPLRQPLKRQWVDSDLANGISDDVEEVAPNRVSASSELGVILRVIEGCVEISNVDESSWSEDTVNFPKESSVVFNLYAL
jgi:hypothetical protein